MNRFVPAAALTAMLCASMAGPVLAAPEKVVAAPAASVETGKPATPMSDPAKGGSALYDTVAALDTQMFDSFNHCDDPAQFERHRAVFDEKVEFYHDNGGVTWSREEMLGNVRKNVCGKFRRELIPGTLRVYPIKDFGAMEIGEHRFCATGETKCAGRGEFILVWRRVGEGWQVTRAISYAHRPND
jgi:hypothetical protein